MTDLRGELCYEGELTCLSWRSSIRVLDQRVYQWLVVGEGLEFPALQEVFEVLNGVTDCCELTIICAVFLLSRGEVSGEKM